MTSVFEHFAKGQRQRYRFLMVLNLDDSTENHLIDNKTSPDSLLHDHQFPVDSDSLVRIKKAREEK